MSLTTVPNNMMSFDGGAFSFRNKIKSIWDAYYVRKANGSTDTSYSFAGACPYTVPELMVELGI